MGPPIRRSAAGAKQAPKKASKTTVTKRRVNSSTPAATVRVQTPPTTTTMPPLRQTGTRNPAISTDSNHQPENAGRSTIVVTPRAGDSGSPNANTNPPPHTPAPATGPDMRAIVEMAGKTTMGIAEMLLVMSSKVKTKLFTCRKFPMMSGSKEEARLRSWAQKELSLQLLDSEMWYAIRTQITKTLRSKRSTVTLDMKEEFMSELIVPPPCMPAHSLTKSSLGPGLLSGRDGREPDVVPAYTRRDFLLFDVASKGDNRDILNFFEPERIPNVPEASQPKKEDVEDPEKWSGYNDWKDYPTLAEGRGLEVMAWTIFNFAPCVVHKSRLPTTDKWAGTPLKKWLTMDDIAFLLITLENCINKWIRLYQKLKEKKEQALQVGVADVSRVFLPKEELAAIPGTKFPSGSGVSGRVGQERFNALKLYIQRNYYDDSPIAQGNCDALAKVLENLVEAEEKKRASSATASADAAPEDIEPHVVTNPALDSLHDMEWNLCMGDGVGITSV